MKVLALLFLSSVVILVKCEHTFMGTNVIRPLIYHHNAEFSPKTARKRIENMYFMIPLELAKSGRTIQGILMYDQTQSGASAKVTQGGIGFEYVNIRMKSDRGEKLHYDIYIYS